MSDEQNVSKTNHRLVTMDEIHGYAAMQREELAQTLALLDITTQQISSCETPEEIEKIFDDAIALANGKLEDTIKRRICRSITLVGLMTQTPIPTKYYVMDELVYKATVELMRHQKALQDETAVAAAEAGAQATEVTH